MTNNSSYKQLVQNLEYLNLKQMQTHLDDVINFSLKNNLSLTDALIKLTSYEIDFKEKNMIKSMVKVAAFPHLKELHDFDFDFHKKIINAIIRTNLMIARRKICTECCRRMAHDPTVEPLTNFFIVNLAINYRFVWQFHCRPRHLALQELFGSAS